jgi:hypothetical protein
MGGYGYTVPVGIGEQMTGNRSRNGVQGRPRRSAVSRLASGIGQLVGRPVASQIAGTVRRLLQPPVPGPRAVPAVREQDPGLERARAALANARTQMPGLLGGNGPIPESGNMGLQALVAQASTSTFELSVGMGGMARIEEAILRLEDERLRLSAEVAELRLAVGELREILRRPDSGPGEDSGPREDSGLRAQDSARPELAWALAPPDARPEPNRKAAESANGATLATDARETVTERQEDDTSGQEPPAEEVEGAAGSAPVADAGIVYPSGSVGVSLRVAAVSGPVMLDAIHRVLTALAEVDGVRLVSYADGQAEFRVYLRQPLTRVRLLASLAGAGPGLRTED